MQSRRIDLEREIFIRVPAFDSFVTEYSSNISTTGMFIRSEKPLPPDTDISFEFRIADDWKLMHGTARVVWARYRDEGPGQPAGMGVLFTELEPQSRRLIGWIIEKHVREGGTPFELQPSDEALADLEAEPSETTAPAAGRAPEPPLPRRSEPRHLRIDRPKAGARQAPVRLRLAPLLLTGLAVTLVLAGLFWLSERGAQSVANPDLEPDQATVATSDEPPAGRADEQVAASPSDTPSSTPQRQRAAPDRATGRPAAPPGPAVSPPATQTPPSTAPDAADASPVFVAAAERLVAGWSRAWSDQDVDAYLSYYSRNFRPADGRNRSAWAADRRERLRAPQFIEISIADLEAELSGPSGGRVSFDQGYRSNTYQDTVRKVLELIREDGRWKILEEKTAG